VGRGARIENVQVFASAALLPPRPHIAPELRATPSGRALPRSERPQIAPSTALQRRRER